MEDNLKRGAFRQDISRKNCVAYCKLHKCYLSKTHIKNMSCTMKKCKHLVKLDCPFWKYKDNKNKDKKLRKKEIYGKYKYN